MNRLYLLSWYYQGQGGESDARNFFGKLREGIEKGKKFPFNCPCQIGLVHCTVDEHWAVGVLVMRGTEGDDSIEQTNRLHKWFEECGADFSGTDTRGEQASQLSVEGTLQSRYGSHYTCIEVFDPLSIVAEDKDTESKAESSPLENLNSEDKAIATDLIRMGDDNPDERYKAYNVLDQKRYKDNVLLSGIARIEAEIPSNDVATRVRLYCGLGVWLGGNIYSRPKGIELIRHAIELSTNMAVPHALLGTLLMGDSSNVYLERGESSFRQHPELSDVELESLSKEFHSQAQEELESAIHLDPNDPTPYYAFCKSPFLDFSQLKNQYLQGVQRDKTHSPEFGGNHWSFAIKAAKFNQGSDATDAFLRAMIVSPQEYYEGPRSVRPKGGLALSCWQTAKQQIAYYRNNTEKINALWLVSQQSEEANAQQSAQIPADKEKQKMKAREQAQRWWQSSQGEVWRSKGGAKCDAVSSHIIADGQGYLCRPKKPGDPSPDLVCEECFDQYNYEAWEISDDSAMQAESMRIAQDVAFEYLRAAGINPTSVSRPASIPIQPKSSQPVALPSVEPQVARQTNGLAVASMILGIASIPFSLCYGVGVPLGIAAVIMGVIARKQIREHTQEGDGKALTGIITGGLTTIGVLAIVILALLGPVIANVFSGMTSSLPTP